jgi:uncharacterized repeat protein (TIGR03803 family)
MPGKLTVSLTFTLILVLFTSAFAGTEKVLYSFTGGADGDEPYAGVIFDNAGNLYGTTQYGGAHGDGVVFELSPSQNGWTETVLYTFTGGTDGSLPLGGVIFDGAGNLYGTAGNDGDPLCRCGVVYKLAPSGGGWTFSVLHAFTGDKDGAYPGAGLVLAGGDVGGTTVYGGADDCGTAFYLPVAGGSEKVFTLKCGNGNQPWANLTPPYGTSFAGGKHGVGNVFELGFRINNVHVFDPKKPLGYYPVGPVLQGKDGSLYGTTSAGGVGGGGAVYGLLVNPKTGRFKPAALHGFTYAEGSGPASGLVMDAAGNLYGATVFGGTAGPNPDGVVFKLTPGPKNKWTETVLYSFSGGADGGGLYGTIISDAAGNLYGVGIDGGAYGAGVVFEVTP